jgi:hypothetical protein
MGDHLGTRIVAGSKARYCRIPLGYGCPGCAGRWHSITAPLPKLLWDTPHGPEDTERSTEAPGGSELPGGGFSLTTTPGMNLVL